MHYRALKSNALSVRLVYLSQLSFSNTKRNPVYSNILGMKSKNNSVSFYRLNYNLWPIFSGLQQIFNFEQQMSAYQMGKENLSVLRKRRCGARNFFTEGADYPDGEKDKDMSSITLELSQQLHQEGRAMGENCPRASRSKGPWGPHKVN